MPSPNKLHSVLFLGAHPDDETIMAGGTLAMLHAHGVHTHIVCATDGRGGESGEVVAANSPPALATVRQAEVRAAAAVLGAELTLLGYEDPVIGPDEELYPFTTDEEALALQLAGLIRDAEVEVVLCHGSDGEYGHPAHKQVHRATLCAIREHLPHLVCYGVAGWLPDFEDRIWNKSDPAHLALDITPWIEAKHQAMLAHRSQHQLFKRRRKLEPVRQAVRPIETFHRHWPALPPDTPPDDAFAALLLQVGAWRPASG
ncbi:MAG: PIG-L family deacetylase [Chloroflexi bacterium]|nr:PIG-L family deacetylase [Chloroflexota bacterium]